MESERVARPNALREIDVCLRFVAARDNSARVNRAFYHFRGHSCIATVHGNEASNGISR